MQLFFDRAGLSNFAEGDVKSNLYCVTYNLKPLKKRYLRNNWAYFFPVTIKEISFLLPSVLLGVILELNHKAEILEGNLWIYEGFLRNFSKDPLKLLLIYNHS